MSVRVRWSRSANILHPPSVNASVYFSKSLAIGLPLSRTDTKRDGSCPMESIRQHFTPSVNASVYFSKSSRSDFRSVEPTQRETGRVRPCPMESIRQHFTPSVNSSVYFSKSLAIGLPVSRTVAYPRRSDSVRVYWTCMAISVLLWMLSKPYFSIFLNLVNAWQTMVINEVCSLCLTYIKLFSLFFPQYN